MSRQNSYYDSKNGMENLVETLFEDNFTIDESAPIAAGDADVRGYRVINDAESLMSISGGVLNVPAQATAVWGDEYYRAQPSAGQAYWERPAGKALVAAVDFRHSTKANQIPVGWWNTTTLDASTNALAGSFTSSSLGIVSQQSGNVVSDTQAYSAATDYPSVAVWDSAGFHTFVKISGVWHRKWFAPSAATQAYTGMSNFASVGSLKYFKVVAVDESFFAPALSIAAPAVGNLPDMPDGDFLLYLDNITRPSAGSISFRYRKQDVNNYWRENVDGASGSFAITEFVAGGGTTRISSSGVVNTDDLTTIARGALIQAWRNTTGLGSAYTSAYNFLREKLLELNSLGTGGAIANLYAWKARLSNETGLGAELVVNGDFATDTDWTKGIGWTILGGAAHKAPSAGTENLVQLSILEVGKYYEISFTVLNYVAGSLTLFIGSQGATSPVTANGTYTYQGVCSGSASLVFNGTAASDLSIDNVSVKEITFTPDSLALMLDGVAS